MISCMSSLRSTYSSCAGSPQLLQRTVTEYGSEQQTHFLSSCDQTSKVSIKGSSHSVGRATLPVETPRGWGGPTPCCFQFLLAAQSPWQVAPSLWSSRPASSNLSALSPSASPREPPGSPRLFYKDNIELTPRSGIQFNYPKTLSSIMPVKSLACITEQLKGSGLWI